MKPSFINGQIKISLTNKNLDKKEIILIKNDISYIHRMIWLEYEILSKDTTIPCSYKKYFTTSEDLQREITVKLFQGERDNINDNFYLGSFVMDNLDPEPQGKIVVIINVSVSTDGLITVEGKVKNTEKFNKKIIINRYDMKLNESQILNNIKNYELSDHVFNSIIQKYYHLITMLNRLQYNLLDNIIINTEPNVEYMKMVQNIFNAFWTDLKSVYKMMSQSEKINPNISQLTKLISNIESLLFEFCDFSISYVILSFYFNLT
jgi:molecular chaperone DnaK (HSP70)